MGTGSFPGIESDRGVTLTYHPLLVQRSKNRVNLTSTLPKRGGEGSGGGGGVDDGTHRFTELLARPLGCI
jgi:hypothetical protein